MNISDLNYLEVLNSETENSLRGGGNINVDIFKNVNFNKFVNKDINKQVTVNVDIVGYLAEAEADAEAFGSEVYYPLAETDTFAIVDATEGHTAFAYSESTAALDLIEGAV